MSVGRGSRLVLSLRSPLRLSRCSRRAYQGGRGGGGRGGSYGRGGGRGGRGRGGGRGGWHADHTPKQTPIPIPENQAPSIVHRKLGKERAWNPPHEAYDPIAKTYDPHTFDSHRGGMDMGSETLTGRDLTVKTLMEYGMHIAPQFPQEIHEDMYHYITKSKYGEFHMDLGQVIGSLRRILGLVRQLSLDGCTPLWVINQKSELQRNLFTRVARRLGHPYLDRKWIPGLFTNWNSLSAAVRPEKKIEKGKVPKNLASKWRFIRSMDRIPDMIIVPERDGIFNIQGLLFEAQRSRIPTMGFCGVSDSTVGFDYMVPFNKDSLQAQWFVADLIARAWEEAKDYQKAKEEAGIDAPNKVNTPLSQDQEWAQYGKDMAAHGKVYPRKWMGEDSMYQHSGRNFTVFHPDDPNSVTVESDQYFQRPVRMPWRERFDNEMRRELNDPSVILGSHVRAVEKEMTKEGANEWAKLKRYEAGADTARVRIFDSRLPSEYRPPSEAREIPTPISDIHDDALYTKVWNDKKKDWDFVLRENLIEQRSEDSMAKMLSLPAEHLRHPAHRPDDLTEGGFPLGSEA